MSFLSFPLALQRAASPPPPRPYPVVSYRALCSLLPMAASLCFLGLLQHLDELVVQCLPVVGVAVAGTTLRLRLAHLQQRVQHLTQHTAHNTHQQQASDTEARTKGAKPRRYPQCLHKKNSLLPLVHASLSLIDCRVWIVTSALLRVASACRSDSVAWCCWGRGMGPAM